MEEVGNTDVKTRLKVPVRNLRKETNPDIFPFETTAELEKKTESDDRARTGGPGDGFRFVSRAIRI